MDNPFPFRMRIYDRTTKTTIAEAFDDKPEVVVRRLAAIWALHPPDSATVEVYENADGWREVTPNEDRVFRLVIRGMGGKA